MNADLPRRPAGAISALYHAAPHRGRELLVRRSLGLLRCGLVDVQLEGLLPSPTSLRDGARAKP